MQEAIEWMMNYTAMCQVNTLLAMQWLGCQPNTGFEQINTVDKSDNISIEPKSPQKKPKLALSMEDLAAASYSSNKKPWTEEEDDLLRHFVEQEKKPWNEVPNLIPGRNQKMCYSRYRRLSLEAKQYWKRAEDEKIVEMVAELGENWRQISTQFQGRSAKQIREHYLNFLRPDIRKDEWTIEEDKKIVDLINQHGKKWKYFETLFEGRTQNQIKNRYYGRLKKMMMKKQKKRKYKY